jgi:hypothetical protein
VSIVVASVHGFLLKFNLDNCFKFQRLMLEKLESIGNASADMMRVI